MAQAAPHKKRGEVLGVYVRPDQAAKIRELAQAEDRSVSQVVRRTIEVGLRDRP